MTRKKIIWNILRLTTGNYVYICNEGDSRAYKDFKTKSEAYWAIIQAINQYNKYLDYFIKIGSKEAKEFSNYKPIDYSEFELIRTPPLQKE